MTSNGFFCLLGRKVNYFTLKTKKTSRPSPFIMKVWSLIRLIFMASLSLSWKSLYCQPPILHRFACQQSILFQQNKVKTLKRPYTQIGSNGVAQNFDTQNLLNMNLKTLGEISNFENILHRINYEVFYMHESRN